MKSILGQNLIGLYQTGSGASDNYVAGKSDLDIIGVVTVAIDKTIKDRIAQELDHIHFPCPAAGLDLILLSESTVRQIQKLPPYEFWFSTGANWPKEKWEEGTSQEMLIAIESCRRNAITLLGESPKTYFHTVPKKDLLQAFIEMLSWHQSRILDPYHDPKGVNSVLNAARILAFAETNTLMSKSTGGKWYLEHKGRREVIKNALAIRENEESVVLLKTAITDFLVEVVMRLKKM